MEENIELCFLQLNYFVSARTKLFVCIVKTLMFFMSLESSLGWGLSEPFVGIAWYVTRALQSVLLYV